MIKLIMMGLFGQGNGLREGMFYERLPGSRVRCHICLWRCNIGPGKLGVCRMRQNMDGVLFTLNYALISSAAVDPIEKKPLFHFFPGSLIFSLGSYGCNFHCLHCQNWQISCVEPKGIEGFAQHLPPEQAIALTLGHRCAGISWTYNEPTIWYEYTYDCARLAKENGLYTVYVTNGSITPEALDGIGPYLDAFRVDVKGFSDSFHQRLARVFRWREVLEVTQRARDKWGMHVEVVTNIIPTLNDDEEQLRGIARWVRGALGEFTPWHVTRFYPQHQLQHIPATPIPTLELAWRIGREEGLRFVYLGNSPGHPGENTLCYSCGQVVVQRQGYNSRAVGLREGQCSQCGADMHLRTPAHAPAQG